MGSARRARITKQDRATIMWVGIPLFAGIGVALILFKLLPHEFGPSGTLVAPMLFIGYGLLLIVTGFLAVTLKLAVFSVYAFLAGLLFGRGYGLAKTPDYTILIGGMFVMVVVFIGANYLSQKFRGNQPQQNRK